MAAMGEASPWGEGVVKEFSPKYYADYLIPARDIFGIKTL